MLVDRAFVLQVLEANSHRAVEAAVLACNQIDRSAKDVLIAVEPDLDGPLYDVSHAEWHHELVSPATRHFVCQLEAH